ncbi:hypothetical protein [Methylobacterium ajmalii]|uniref:hypothetical protein n=1 Tax=Methylobacterium ajmalii TaxID=2738439 RepID=UPI002F3510C2
MRGEIPYRGYTIFHDGNEFVAEPEKPDGDDVVFEMGSSSVDALIDAINDLHAATAATGPVPGWFDDWMKRGCEGRVRVKSLRERLQEVAALGRVAQHPTVVELSSIEGRDIAPRAPQAGRCGWAFGILVMLLAILPLAARAFDFDGDRAITGNDLRIAASLLVLKLMPERVIRTVRFRDRDYKATIEVAPGDLASGGRIAITLQDLSPLIADEDDLEHI